MYNLKPILSKRFEKQVLLHVSKNLMPENRYVPLILGIHGASGEGKTFQCIEILKKYHIKYFFISGGQLENETAGEPSKLIRKEYLNASMYMEDTGKPAIVMMNDIDAGLGSWGDLVQTTINTQNVCVELMNLVDNPNEVEKIASKRVPIIVTGNDFSKLYAPLTILQIVFSKKKSLISHLFSEKEIKNEQ